MNRLQTVTTTEGTSTYTYYANGNRETLTLPDGSVTTYQYNPRNMLTSLVNRTGGVDTTYTYEYDADGLQLYKAEPKGRTDFEYDDLERIKKVTEPGNRITQYTYDNAGNRDTQTVDAPGLDVDIIYTYNTQNWLVQTIETHNGATTTAALTYDDNGNQKTVTETGPSGTRVSTYEYDNFNQLKMAQMPDGEVITSKYDATGMRIEKTVNGVTTTYHYDGANVILEETGGTHNRNIYGINLIARNDGAGALYYLFNGHGDVVKLINASGSLVNEYDYDIFGNPLLVNESKTNPFRYCGEYFDKETGTIYLRARYYDPEIGRFISEDSYWGKENDPLSLNLYTYCSNNPIMYFDPSGHIVTGWDTLHLDIFEQLDLSSYSIYYEIAQLNSVVPYLQYNKSEYLAEMNYWHKKSYDLRVANGFKEKDTYDYTYGGTYSGRIQTEEHIQDEKEIAQQSLLMLGPESSFLGPETKFAIRGRNLANTSQVLLEGNKKSGLLKINLQLFATQDGDRIKAIAQEFGMNSKDMIKRFGRYVEEYKHGLRIPNKYTLDADTLRELAREFLGE